MDVLCGGGADMLELGMPFSDPTADGPIIERAHHRALSSPTTMASLFQMIGQWRTQNTTTPLILMGYANPVLACGMESFFAQAAQHGVDGLILVDVPLEESPPFAALARTHHMALIRLIAPNTEPERLERLLNDADGFVYHVARTGVTGTQLHDKDALTTRLRWVKQRCSLPLVVGFGIKTGHDVAHIARYADGVVVGSALVDIIAQNVDDDGMMKKRIQDKMYELSHALSAQTL